MRKSRLFLRAIGVGAFANLVKESAQRSDPGISLIASAPVQALAAKDYQLGMEAGTITWVWIGTHEEYNRLVRGR
jgi:hypothetical protein